jgi:hypothetical protein
MAQGDARVDLVGAPSKGFHVTQPETLADTVRYFEEQ